MLEDGLLIDLESRDGSAMDIFGALRVFLEDEGKAVGTVTGTPAKSSRVENVRKAETQTSPAPNAIVNSRALDQPRDVLMSCSKNMQN